MPNATQLAAGDPALMDAVRRARKLLHRRALAGAAAGAVPIPGLDWVADVALLSRMVPAISREFGLTPEQLAKLPARKRVQVENAAIEAGSILIGKSITKDLAIRAITSVGKRLTAKQAAKFVPLGGQMVSALISYTAIRYLGEQHIHDCVAVCKAAHLKLPAPSD